MIHSLSRAHIPLLKLATDRMTNREGRALCGEFQGSLLKSGYYVEIFGIIAPEGELPKSF
jgi:hypothetical protein